jgi:hypothetical protein
MSTKDLGFTDHYNNNSSVADNSERQDESYDVLMKKYGQLEEILNRKDDKILHLTKDVLWLENKVVDLSKNSHGSDQEEEKTTATKFYSIPSAILDEIDGTGGACAATLKAKAFEQWRSDDWNGLSDPDPRVGIHVFMLCLLSAEYDNREKLQKINNAREHLLAARCTHTKTVIAELKNTVEAAMITSKYPNTILHLESSVKDCAEQQKRTAKSMASVQAKLDSVYQHLLFG